MIAVHEILYEQALCSIICMNLLQVAAMKLIVMST